MKHNPRVNEKLCRFLQIEYTHFKKNPKSRDFSRYILRCRRCSQFVGNGLSHLAARSRGPGGPQSMYPGISQNRGEGHRDKVIVPIRLMGLISICQCAGMRLLRTQREDGRLDIGFQVSCRRRHSSNESQIRLLSDC